MLRLVAAEALAIDFPFARCIVAVESTREFKKGKPGKPDLRYYLSSQYLNERTPQQWMELIRGHWAGVEIRNHWRRDSCWQEDKTRSRNPNILANLALIRSILFHPIHQHYAGEPLPAVFESLARDPNLAIKMLFNHL